MRILKLGLKRAKKILFAPSHPSSEKNSFNETCEIWIPEMNVKAKRKTKMIRVSLVHLFLFKEVALKKSVFPTEKEGKRELNKAKRIAAIRQ